MSADFDDLPQAAAELEARIAGGDLGVEVVHSAVSVFGQLGRDEAAVDLLARYLRTPLDSDEEAWARSEHLDRLARLGRCEQAVQAQRAFLDWARQALAPDRLLTLMAAETPALCWVTVGHGDEWLELCSQLMAATTASEENRLERLMLIRAAGIVLANLGQYERALAFARRMRQIADEDPEWPRGYWARTESRILQLHSYQAGERPELLRRTAEAVTVLLDRQYDRHLRGEPTDVDVVQLRSLYQRAAVPLYLDQCYDLALPLLERAVELGATDPHVHAWAARARAILEQ